MKKLVFSILCTGLITVFLSCGDDDSMIDLPQHVQDYIASNYPEYSIDESEMDSLCDGTEVYEVEIEANDDDELELVFDSESFLYAEMEIENSELPVEVTNSISANYAGYSIEEAEQLEMADGSNRYEVEIKDGSTTLEVLFDAAGTVICEAIDDDE